MIVEKYLLKIFFKILNKLPVKFRRNIVKIIIELRYLFFIIIFKIRTYKYNTKHEKIYWISPDRIIYHTNYINKKNKKHISLEDRVFPKKMRGKILDGDWDKTDHKFTDLKIYNAIERRINENMEWQNTEFYKGILKCINSDDLEKKAYWGCLTKNDLDERCKYIDSLIQNIKYKGYQLNRFLYNNDINYNEIEVNIGRNGNYLFHNGRHRLAIAKILGIKSVPVMVFVRHKEWQEFRKFVFDYANHMSKGKLYQPAIHPDLNDIPFYHTCQDRFKIIVKNLKKIGGTLLDIGANIGFFCHKFEDLGFKCYAIERDPATVYILNKLKVAENKKFKIINKDLFEIDITNMKFDVVLALNIFHHFLKEKETFLEFENFLKNLKTDVMFFQPHQFQEPQMKNAYKNLTENEFIQLILKHTTLKNYKNIYTDMEGRNIYKLYK